MFIFNEKASDREYHPHSPPMKLLFLYILFQKSLELSPVWWRGAEVKEFLKILFIVVHPNDPTSTPSYSNQSWKEPTPPLTIEEAKLLISLAPHFALCILNCAFSIMYFALHIFHCSLCIV